MGRVAAIERVLAVVAVAATVLAMVLAVEVRTAPGADRWTEGPAGAWLWLWCGVVPVVVAALVAVVRRRRGSARLLLGAAVAVALSTALGEAMHVVEPGFDRHVVGAVGAGLDVVGVLLAVAAVATLLRPRLARPAALAAMGAGVVAAVAFAARGDPTVKPMHLPAVSPLQVPSLVFYARTGEPVLLALALGPFVAVGLLAWSLAGASHEARRELRWLAVAIVAGIGAIAVFQLTRLIGVVDVSEGLLVAVPRCICWVAAACGVAATVVQPGRGDAATTIRRIAVGAAMVCILGAAGGLAWFAGDATTGDLFRGAPALAAALTVAALAVPVHDRLERAADRWLISEVGSAARLLDGFGAATEHAERAEVLQLLVATARRAVRVRWARATTTVPSPAFAMAGVGVDDRAAPDFAVALVERGEQLGVLECGPKRFGQLSAADRRLLGALGREAALRLRSVGQADELAVRVRQIEEQAAELAASRARIVEAEDQERRRIERDIHDGVQQDLAALLGTLRVARTQLATSPDNAAATIAHAQEDVRRTLADVRAIAQGIHPAILDDHGIVPALAARTRRLPLDITYDVAPELTGRRFDRRIEGAAYFVVAEALANIVKHADATAVTVALAVDDGRLVVRVDDDGRGLGDPTVGGRGLVNMADRSAALGGAVHVEAGAAGGTSVVVVLPIDPPVLP